MTPPAHRTGRAITGFYVRFGTSVDAGANARVHALCRALLAHPAPGVTDLVPGYASLYVEFDATRTDAATLERWVEAAQVGADPTPARLVEIEVAYDGADLAAVAALADLSAEQVIDLHSSREYRVYGLGFTPGFPYLGEVDPRIRVPRLPAPRARVEAHSVGVADAQTGVYPVASPGGWRIVGTALQAVYDPNRERPFLLDPGDRVRFRPAHGERPPAPGQVELLPAEPLHPALRVLEPGLLDLLVDGGRTLAGRYGLARSGPLDPQSAGLANRLLGNDPGAPVIEMNVRGPVVELLRDAVLSFAGHGLAPTLNGAPVAPFTSFFAPAGSVLRFAPQPHGVRGYLAVAGGFRSERFLGSVSVDLRGGIGRPLAAGDVLGLERPRTPVAGFSFTPHRRFPAVTPLRLLPGPQASRAAAAALTSAVFTVVSADRMGIRFDGPSVPGGEVVSEAAPIGAVQVTPAGAPILLLADRGTVGGYAKPAVLNPAELSKAGQLKTGDRVRFVLASSWAS